MKELPRKLEVLQDRGEQMVKKRVYELARELQINSKDLLSMLQQLGIMAKNHMSTLSEEEADKIRAAYAMKNKTEKQHDKEKKVTKTEENKKKRFNDKDNNESYTEEEQKEDYRNRIKAKKEELRRSQEEAQRKLISKVVEISSKSRKKKRHYNERSAEKTVIPKKITIGESVTVQELAQMMNIDGDEAVKKLVELGIMASLSQEIDGETAALVAAEFGSEAVIETEEEELERFLFDYPDDPSEMALIPPIVTVMGHVDHGKTSLLDAIRKTKVTATEAGGITQHIGAYQVEVKGKKITFLDTPGHEAFTAMRARGAQVTNIAILVVAADDGVMPQTIEAINHARAADVPIVVAINKIDKPQANPQRVLQQLTEHGLVPEEWGGETICVPVSAVSGEGLDHLLEMLLLVAEIEELKANPKRPAQGVVIEAKLDKGKGPVATVLVQKGTLRVGDYIIAGTAYGRVRAMIDYRGQRIKKAAPSTPVEILGLSDVPMASDAFYVAKDEKSARQLVEKRVSEQRRQKLSVPGTSLEDLFKKIQEGEVKELNLIIKSDVQGTVEALTQALNKLNTPDVRVNTIHTGVGAIRETDVMLASASNGLIIGFNVRPDINARKIAETQKVEIRLYRVIYEAVKDIRAALEGMLEPDYKEVIVGRAEVRDIFRIPKIGVIAGCYIVDGKVFRNAHIRLIRDGVVIYEGTVSSLKRFKDDTREVAQGHECGIGLDKFQDIKQGDVLEIYQIEEIKKVLQT